MSKDKDSLGQTSILTHAQVVRRAKAIVQRALDERDKAIAEAQGMLTVVSAVMMQQPNHEIILTQDELDNAPRQLAFETDANGTRRICQFEMREKKQCSAQTQEAGYKKDCVLDDGHDGDHHFDAVAVPAPVCTDKEHFFPVNNDGDCQCGLVNTCRTPVSRETPTGAKIELM